jgi:hypothetical protein
MSDLKRGTVVALASESPWGGSKCIESLIT